MGLSIITADQRMAEKRGIKALILGPAGIGKTSLLRTIDPATTLFLDFEAGDLAVQDVPVDQLRPQTWEECRDLACFLAGPDLNLTENAVYGAKHYAHACDVFGAPDALDKYETFFIDSITVAGRLCFRWCQQQPEAHNAKGVPDTRGAYGLHGREMVSWITQLQHARTKNVIFVCLLDQKEDEFGRTTWSPQIEGSKTGREMPGIVDEVITMALIRPEDGEPFRAFVTAPDNAWDYPAKDRSGRLDAMEAPDLGALFAKLKSARAEPAKTPTRAPANTNVYETEGAA
jgi:hypothetical protein